MHVRFATRVLVCLFVCFTVVPAAFALRTGDTTVVVPIVGRFAGAAGTQWRTDVFVANHTSDVKTVQMTLYVAGGSPVSVSVPLGAYSNATFQDIVLNTFGLTTGSGELQLVSSTTGAIEARARIYNAGNPAGEFGQNVPGLGMSSLRRQAFVYGLSGLGGNRVNVGVTNPNDFAISVTMRLTSRTDVPLHVTSVELQPHQNVQFNDVFSRFGIPLQADVQLQFITFEHAMYGYASEVRNDTGDAIFIAGTSPNV